VGVVRHPRGKMRRRWKGESAALCAKLVEAERLPRSGVESRPGPRKLTLVEGFPWRHHTRIRPPQKKNNFLSGADPSLHGSRRSRGLRYRQRVGIPSYTRNQVLFCSGGVAVRLRGVIDSVDGGSKWHEVECAAAQGIGRCSAGVFPRGARDFDPRGEPPPARFRDVLASRARTSSSYHYGPDSDPCLGASLPRLAAAGGEGARPARY